MCAIIGIVRNLSKEVINNFRKCRDSMVHRGPDHAGEWFKFDAGVALGSRRLSIFDLTAGSNQPLIIDNGNLVLVFNGAIYNFIELRTILENKGHIFKTNGDTEVLLYAYKEWGFDCLKYLNGMWAFAIYDQRKGPGNEQLFVARDRSGEKPFFYRCDSGSFEFASELKGLLTKSKINLQALNYYLAMGYIPGDLCIETGVKKLPPGYAGVFNFRNRQFKNWKYWELPIQNLNYINKISSEQLVDETWNLLVDSVKLRLRSDVPTGIFLSGGIDSSLITAAAVQVSNYPIKTFTISIPGSTLDETSHAQLIAKTFNTQHYLLPIDSYSLDVIDELLPFVDEPLADSSIIPTYLLSKMTSKHVKVVLGGDGGDELYGGYHHYQSNLRNQLILGWLPISLFKIISLFSSKLQAGTIGRNLLCSFRGGPQESSIWSTPFFDLNLRKHLFKPEILNELGDNIDSPERSNLNLYYQGHDSLDRMMRFDFNQRLPDDYLVKIDRASMANSLEIRTPFLDHRIVEHAYKIIPSFLKTTIKERRKIQNLMAKKYLPKEFEFNRKQGFSVPINEWMKKISPEHVLPKNFKNIFNMNFIENLIAGQSKGKRNGERLFALNMLRVLNNR